MTTPQVFLIMLGLGLLAYVLITGFRSSRTAISRQHRRRWWLGVIAGTAVALSPLSQFWRKPFNSIDLLTQSLLISAVSLLALLLFALLLTPFKALTRFFRKRRQSVEHMLTRNDEGLSPIPIDAESSMMLGNTAVGTIDSPDSLQSMYNTSTGEKSIVDTINESGEFRTPIELPEPAYVNDSVNENASGNVDQASTRKLKTANIESVVPLQGKTDGTQQLDGRLSRSSAANDKIGITANRAERSLEHAAPRDIRHPDAEFPSDKTVPLDELVDETLRLDELADDTLRLDEVLPNGEMPANSEQQANTEQQVISEQNTEQEPPLNVELQSVEASQTEESLLAEDGLLAEDELDIASIPSDEESFDLSETGNLFAAIRSEPTELELPDDKELRDAKQTSANEEFDLDTALLEAEKAAANEALTNISRQAEIAEADVIHNDIDLGPDEADLEFGNDLTGEYAHPAEENDLTTEEAAEEAQEATEQLAEKARTPQPVTKRVANKQKVTEPTNVERLAKPAKTEKRTEKRVPEKDFLVVHNTTKKVAEPKTLAAALVAAKLTAESVEAQVSNLEKRIAKLDGYRNASIDSATTNAEQHTVAMEQTNALITSEDEARRAAEVQKNSKPKLTHCSSRSENIYSSLKVKSNVRAKWQEQRHCWRAKQRLPSRK